MAEPNLRRGEVRINSQFAVISKGMIECPKCFGATEIDMTARTETGWPLSKPRRMTCDHCEGKGEVAPDKGFNPATDLPPEAPPAPSGWGNAPLEPGPVKIEPQGWPSAPVDTVAEGWAVFNG